MKKIKNILPVATYDKTMEVTKIVNFWNLSSFAYWKHEIGNTEEFGIFINVGYTIPLFIKHAAGKNPLRRCLALSGSFYTRAYN